MSKSPVQIQLDNARKIAQDRGIDIPAMRPIMRSMYPQLHRSADEMVDMGTIGQIAIISELQPPHDMGSVARQLADRHGAFPYDGPVGNGLTLEYYQGKFREMAEELLFLGKRLGLVEGDSE